MIFPKLLRQSPPWFFASRLVVAVVIGSISLRSLPSLAAGLLVNPGSITNTYSGSVTLQISGLTNGEAVLVERFLDLNASGQIDSTDWLVGSLTVADGKVASFGGVTDPDIPGDNDSVPGQITTSFVFLNLPELSRLAGTQLVRVSSPTGRFAPVVQPLHVNQTTYSQSITGVITANGTPVPYAGVGILAPVGNDVQFVAGTISDGSGNFSLSAPPGSYVLFPAKPGFVADLGLSSVTLNSNQTLTQNSVLNAGQHRISGKVSDATTGAGLAGLQMFFESPNNLALPAFTDADGNFSVLVTPDQWKIDLSDFSIVPIGYLRPQNKVTVTINSNDVTGVAFPLARGTALIYGSLKNETNAPLAGVSLYGSNNLGTYQNSVITDANGNYDLLVRGGESWNIGLDNNQPVLTGYTLQGTNLTLAPGQAFQLNLVAQRVSAHLTGHVVNSTGGALAGITILAVPQNGGPTSATAVTGTDGSFDLGVSAGSWSIQLETGGAAANNLIGPSLSCSIADGMTISGITYVAQTVIAYISGIVSNNSGAPISGVFVYASRTLNGTNFNANTQTDAGGHYQLGVFNGNWQVGVDCPGLDSLGYGCPSSQNVAVLNGGNVGGIQFTVYPPVSAPLLSGAGFLPNGKFQFLVNGAPGQNYTVQDSVSFTNWTTLFVTNTSTGPFAVVDPNPKGLLRFYRVLVGP